MAVAVAFGLGVWAGGTILETPSAPPAGPDELWYRVAEETVGRELALPVRSRWDPAEIVLAPTTGVLTEQVVPDGGAIDDGGVLGTVDLAPVIAAIGSIPSFRALGMGSEGRDVAQLQTFLARGGWYRGRATGAFDAATEAAVRRWERAIGAAESGTVPLGRLVYVDALPSSVRWNAAVGAVLAPGGSLVEILRPDPTFTALLTPDQVTELDPGAPVGVRTEAGRSWVASLGPSVVDGELIEVPLVGSPTICGSECSELPVHGEARLRGAVTLVPSTTGPAVPVSAVRTDVQRGTYVTVRGEGDRSVTVLATASGMSVVDGIDVGDEVAIPVGEG